MNAFERITEKINRDIRYISDNLRKYTMHYALNEATIDDLLKENNEYNNASFISKLNKDKKLEMEKLIKYSKMLERIIDCINNDNDKDYDARLPTPSAPPCEEDDI